MMMAQGISPRGVILVMMELEIMVVIGIRGAITTIVERERDVVERQKGVERIQEKRVRERQKGVENRVERERQRGVVEEEDKLII